MERRFDKYKEGLEQQIFRLYVSALTLVGFGNCAYAAGDHRVHNLNTLLGKPNLYAL